MSKGPENKELSHDKEFELYPGRFWQSFGIGQDGSQTREVARVLAVRGRRVRGRREEGGEHSQCFGGRICKMM